MDLDGFGLDGLNPVASGKGYGFRSRDREAKSGGRKNEGEFQVHCHNFRSWYNFYYKRSNSSHQLQSCGDFLINLNLIQVPDLSSTYT
ncbi:MAG: hypothetical protein WBV79_14790, partial [Rhodomicrobium sp.]